MSETAPYFFNFIALSVFLLPIYYAWSNCWHRRSLLIAAGIYMLYLEAPRMITFYLFFWLFVGLGQCLIAKEAKAWNKAILFWFFSLGVLLPMLIWKITPKYFFYGSNFCLHQVTSWLAPVYGEMDGNWPMLIPLGLSFSTFRALDLLIGAYLEIQESRSWGEILFFGFFPPVLVMGPIIQYGEIEGSVTCGASGSVSQALSRGFTRIAIGLTKIYLLALPLAFSKQELLAFNQGTVEWWRIGGDLVLFAWFFYFNFAGFSDLAIGCAHLYGYQLKENFNYPFFQPNLQRFWACWHISLTQFAQRNVFVPMGGYRKTRQYLALVVTIMVIALWHDISWGLVMFGAFHSAGLCLLRFWNSKHPAQAARSNLWRYGGPLATFLFVTLSLPLLIMPLTKALHFYLYLFTGII